MEANVRHHLVVVILVAVAAAHLHAQSLTVARERSEQKFARLVALPAPLAVGAEPVTVETPDRRPIARVHAVVTGGSGSGATLACQPAAEGSPARPLDSGDAWSGDLVLPTGGRATRVTCRIVAPAGGAAPPQVSIDGVAVGMAAATPQAITPPGDQTEPIYAKTGRIREWGRSVGRLQIVGADGFLYYCTAFVVSPRLMLTNAHCIDTDAEMRSALVDFDYDRRKPSATVGFTELAAMDRALDYALLRLAEPTARTPLTLRGTPLAEKSPLVIIEHPGGRPKRVSLVDCRVRGVSLPGLAGMTDFGHFCDTEGGSSGSAIQDFASGAVIGLHHLGFEQGSTPVNRGVLIGLVLADIRAKNAAAGSEIQ